MTEYTLIRDEIIAQQKLNQANDNIMYALTSAILAFALGTGNKDYVVCLIPLFVIVPLCLRSIEHYEGTAQLRAYLHVFRDGKSFMWERRSHEYDKQFNHGWLSYKFFSPLRYYMLILICGIAAWMKYSENKKYKSIVTKILAILKAYDIVIDDCNIILYLCLFACFIIFWRTNNFVYLRSKYIRQWEEIKRVEGISNP